MPINLTDYKRPYQQCVRCVMDTTDPEIIFTSEGVCNHCSSAEQKLRRKPYSLPPDEKARWFTKLVTEIKENGRGKQYDCVIGVSGGVDSSYVAYLVKEVGLKPLAVHVDNGWNSEVSVQNIQNICRVLSIDLYTEVLDWRKFRNLQFAFLRASTPDLEIPSDHAIFATLYKMASKYNVKYILSGSNLATESILPTMWAYGHHDWSYIKDINSKFGSKSNLKNYPHYSIWRYVYYRFIRGISWISTLDYVSYQKEEAKRIIIEKLKWSDYGGKHHESLITKFLQLYILPEKFNIDKRKAHLSSQIVSGQLTRDEALKQLEQPFFKSNLEKEQDLQYVSKKFGLSVSEFRSLMVEDAKFYFHYKNYLTSKLGKLFLGVYYRYRKKAR